MFKKKLCNRNILRYVFVTLISLIVSHALLAQNSEDITSSDTPAETALESETTKQQQEEQAQQSSPDSAADNLAEVTETPEENIANQQQEEVLPQPSSPPDLVNPENEFPILQQNTPNAVSIRPVGIWDTVRVFLVLIFVILGIYAVIWFLKRVQKKSFIHSELIEVLSSHSLSGGGNLHLVKIGKSFFFIGSSNQNVSLIKEITNKEEVDEINLNLSFVEENTDKDSFSSRIVDVFKKFGKQKNTTNSSNLFNSTFKNITSLFSKQIQRGKKLDV